MLVPVYAGHPPFPSPGYPSASVSASARAPAPPPHPLDPGVPYFNFPQTNFCFPPQSSNWPQPHPSQPHPSQLHPSQPRPAQPNAFQPQTFSTLFMDPTRDDHRYDQYQLPEDVYEPNTSGPAIGALLSTEDLVAEYSNADPNFQEKTQSIYKRYSHLRKCRGDGDCGWRAIAFGYFEVLLRAGNASQILKEVEHLREIDQLLIAFGLFDADLLADFTTSTYDLMALLQEWVHLPNRTELLVDFFNTEAAGESRIYFFRLMAFAAVKSNSDEFVNYLCDTGIEEYCSSLLTITFEIDEPAIQALFNILLEPAGIALDILDLNRSPGGDIYIHSRTPRALAVEESTIRLLYKPGHYDLIYRRPNALIGTARPSLIETPSEFPGGRTSQPDVKYEGNISQTGLKNTQANSVTQQPSENPGLCGSEFMVDAKPVFNGTSLPNSIPVCSRCLATQTSEPDIKYDVKPSQTNQRSFPSMQLPYQLSGNLDSGIHDDRDLVQPMVAELLATQYWLGPAKSYPLVSGTLANGLPTSPFLNCVPSPSVSPSKYQDQGWSSQEDLSWLSLYDCGPTMLAPCAPASKKPKFHRPDTSFEHSRANATRSFFPRNLTPKDGEELLSRGKSKKLAPRAVQNAKKKATKIRKGRD